MKNNEPFVFTTHAARELPDPEKGIRHYVLLCKAAKIPGNVPLDPNPRDQNINRSVYKEVRESLLSDSHTFHLKNKGITMLADSVRLDEKKWRAEVRFGKNHGIVDGGHTYRVIQEAIKSGEREVPDEQFVKVEILTGVPDEYVVDIAGGLNTAMQVAEMSLENLKGHFDWIQKDLEGEPYKDRIFYRENAPANSEHKSLVSIREVIAWLTMFLPDKNGFPKDGEHPKMAYGQKAKCLKAFQENLDGYKKMRPILRDILHLHDYILYHAREKYNAAVKGGKAGNLSFMHKKARGAYRLDFTGEEIEHRMHDGALYPILGAFRHLVEKKPDGELGWKLGHFREVEEFCGAILGEMMEFTQKSSVARDRNMDAIGKDDLHWGYLYQMVALKWAQKQAVPR